LQCNKTKRQRGFRIAEIREGEVFGKSKWKWKGAGEMVPDFGVSSNSERLKRGPLYGRYFRDCLTFIN